MQTTHSNVSKQERPRRKCAAQAYKEFAKPNQKARIKLTKAKKNYQSGETASSSVAGSRQTHQTALTESSLQRLEASTNIFQNTDTKSVKSRARSLSLSTLTSFPSSESYADEPLCQKLVASKSSIPAISNQVKREHPEEDIPLSTVKRPSGSGGGTEGAADVPAVPVIETPQNPRPRKRRKVGLHASDSVPLRSMVLRSRRTSGNASQAPNSSPARVKTSISAIQGRAPLASSPSSLQCLPSDQNISWVVPGGASTSQRPVQAKLTNVLPELAPDVIAEQQNLVFDQQSLPDTSQTLTPPSAQRHDSLPSAVPRRRGRSKGLAPSTRGSGGRYSVAKVQPAVPNEPTQLLAYSLLSIKPDRYPSPVLHFPSSAPEGTSTRGRGRGRGRPPKQLLPPSQVDRSITLPVNDDLLIHDPPTISPHSVSSAPQGTSTRGRGRGRGTGRGRGRPRKQPMPPAEVVQLSVKAEIPDPELTALCSASVTSVPEGKNMRGRGRGRGRGTGRGRGRPRNQPLPSAEVDQHTSLTVNVEPPDHEPTIISSASVSAKRVPQKARVAKVGIKKASQTGRSLMTLLKGLQPDHSLWLPYKDSAPSDHGVLPSSCPGQSSSAADAHIVVTPRIWTSTFQEILHTISDLQDHHSPTQNKKHSDMNGISVLQEGDQPFVVVDDQNAASTFVVGVSHVDGDEEGKRDEWFLDLVLKREFYTRHEDVTGLLSNLTLVGEACAAQRQEQRSHSSTVAANHTLVQSTTQERPPFRSTSTHSSWLGLIGHDLSTVCASPLLSKLPENCSTFTGFRSTQGEMDEDDDDIIMSSSSGPFDDLSTAHHPSFRPVSQLPPSPDFRSSTDTSTFIPLQLPSEVQALVDSYANGIPLSLVASKLVIGGLFVNGAWVSSSCATKDKKGTFCLNEEVGYAFMGLWRVVGVMEASLPFSLPPSASSPWLPIDVTRGVAQWTFRLKWIPGDEFLLEDALLHSNQCENISRPWWYPSSCSEGSEGGPTARTPSHPPPSGNGDPRATIASLLAEEDVFPTTPKFRERRKTSKHYEFLNNHTDLRAELGFDGNWRHSQIPFELLSGPSYVGDEKGGERLEKQNERLDRVEEVPTLLGGDASMPPGWLCKRCGKLNERLLLRMRDCKSITCSAQLQAIKHKRSTGYSLGLRQLSDLHEAFRSSRPTNEVLVDDVVCENIQKGIFEYKAREENSEVRWSVTYHFVSQSQPEYSTCETLLEGIQKTIPMKRKNAVDDLFTFLFTHQDNANPEASAPQFPVLKDVEAYISDLSGLPRISQEIYCSFWIGKERPSKTEMDELKAGSGPVVLLCLGHSMDVYLAIVDSGSNKRENQVDASSSLMTQSEQLVSSAATPSIVPVEEDIQPSGTAQGTIHSAKTSVTQSGPVQSATSVRTSKTNGCPKTLKVSLTHGDLLVMQNGLFKWWIVKTGKTLLVSATFPGS